MAGHTPLLAFTVHPSENGRRDVLPREIKATLSAGTTRTKKTVGLRHWMLRVLEECDRVSADFSTDPVHDLRVSLRRCRSLTDGLIALDPNPDWKAMKKAGKRLFQRLGALRDTQVMMEWAEKLEMISPRVEFAGTPASPIVGANESEANSGGAKNTVGESLLEILRRREKEQKLDAHAALEEFDRKQWRQWSKSLPARAARFRPGSALFKHVALERWTAGRELHARALRNRSQTALHELRIGIKRLRYIVENFLPVEHKAWGGDLKEMQDVLGEVHDLDVFWATVISCHVFPDTAARGVWHKKIIDERAKRVEHYRVRMVGPDSLWNVWREALPQGRQAQALALRRMKLWANGLDPDFAHSVRVADLALQLHDGLLAWGWKPAVNGISGRSSLLAAALLHDVGKAAGQKGHHKASFDLIRSHGNPLGWSAADMRRAAVVARFHSGALPSRRHKLLRDLLPDEQKSIIELAAILRLGNALDTAHDGHIRRILVGHAGGPAQRKRGNDGLLRKQAVLGTEEALVIAAEGYSANSVTARTVAAERHLLETVLHRPVLIKPLKRA